MTQPEYQAAGPNERKMPNDKPSETEIGRNPSKQNVERPSESERSDEQTSERRPTEQL